MSRVMSPNPSRRVLLALVAIVVVMLVFFNNPAMGRLGPGFLGPGRASAPITSEEPLYRGPPDLLDDVYNSTLGFEAIFVLGLPTRSDRRDSMTLQASLSNIKIEFVDGVFGHTIPDKAVPSAPDHGRLNDPELGTWRGHMNAVREIVRRNLSSALILEDDTDWDVRLKHELHDLALSTRALVQPLEGTTDQYADPTYRGRSEKGPIVDMDFNDLPRTEPPTYSPYGDGWDMLWLGQCATRFPDGNNPEIPTGRIIRYDDETVPERRYMWSFANPFQLKEDYPEHTRAYHHVEEGCCGLGYALTQRGAQRMLQEVALKDVSEAVDLMFRYFCEGLRGRRKHTCLTVQPGLFQHHRMVGPNRAASDIGDHGDGWRDKPNTDMIRWSTRMNADAIMDGATEFWDSLPNADVPT